MNSGTVLVVDDTLSSLKLVTDILSAEGYQVLPANSGELALAAVALKAPQLILLDLRMPGMDGLEVLRRLKARDESRDIPVMILSAVTESQQRIEGLRLGAVDFLSKPFAREELLARVSTQVSLALVRARLEQQTAELRLSNEQLQIEMVARQRVEDALRLAKEAAEEGLEKERRLLASIVFSSQDAIISKNLDGIVTSWNRGAEKVFGYSAAEIVGQPILMLIPDERRDEENRVLAAIRQGKSIEHYETTRIRKDGRPIEVSVTVSPIRDHQGRIIGASKIARDMSERRQMEDALREQEESFRLIAENLDGFVATLDIDGRRLYNSPSYARLLGTRAILGTLSLDDVHPGDRERVSRAFLDTIATGISQHLEYRFLMADGGICLLESRSGVIRDDKGRTIRVVVVSHDVTERRQAEEKIHHLAFHDPLTQLPNRLMLHDRLDHAMAASKRSGCYGALMFLDLDNFKPLNDTHGHKAGDLLLIEVTARLKSCVREMDTVARFGGDEFVVLLSELHADRDQSTSQAERIAEKIRLTLSEPYRLIIKQGGTANDTTIVHRCTVSIGVVLFIGHEASADDIVKWADAAMYQAKADGRNSIRLHDSKA